MSCCSLTFNWFSQQLLDTCPHLKMQLLILSVLFVMTAFRAFGLKYYVYPSNDDGSPCQYANGCRNLTFYTADIDEYFTDDTIFYFLDGTHILDIDVLIEITDVNNLTFQAIDNEIERSDYDTLMISTTQIKCSSASGGFMFQNSSNILIHGLSFIGCGSATYIPVIFEFAIVSLYFESVFNVTLESLAVVNTTGIGVALTNCFDITILDSSFGMNQLSQECLLSDLPICSGGNIVMHYYETQDMELYNSTSITIMRSNFTRGFSSTPALSGGLALIYQINTTLSVLYDSLVAYGNTGIEGANYNFEISESADYTFIATNVIGLYGNNFDVIPAAITDVIQIIGGGFRIQDTTFSNTQSKYAIVQIINSEFSNNFANSYGGLSLSWLVKGVENINVTIENCRFVNNTGNIGAALYGYASRSLFSQNLYTALKNSYFEGNRAHVDEDEFNAAIFLQNLYIEAENVTVVNTEVTGMILIGSVMSISRNMTYINNSDSTNGGGLSLYETSVLLFNPPFYCSFINNTAARRGGGIYASVSFTSFNEDCFYQYAPTASNRNAESVLYFQGNVAGTAGDVLYGGNIINCVSGVTFRSVFQYPEQTGISVISSDPMTVCFCNNESMPDCNIKVESVSIAPGQTFYMQLVVVGQEEGAVRGIVQITDMTNVPSITVLRNLAVACNNVSYSIKLSNATQAASTLYLPLQRERGVINLDDAKILDISITPCPVGFDLDTVTGECTCIGVLQNVQTVVCDVTTEQMSREGSVWMGYDEMNNCTIVREDCPYDYCLTNNITFHITQPDPQCALNRAGVMCGACAEGYSLMLGTNKCGKCTNVSLLLIVVFFLAGFAIVGLITALNMTLSLGTINGLIFYGNIVKINEDIFFPYGPLPVLSQFISWINLDFGIESCFFDGMTALSKAWLHFVFPLYLWILVIVIIILARYSKIIAKLLGNNSVPVLATLILLSYAKLFRAILNVTIGTTIYCGSSESFAWYVDPNIGYNYPSHLSLVILASFFLFTAALPYTFILLLNQLIIVCLASNWCVKVGCNRLRLSLRLFFDAYNAPYKSSWTASWTGLLLLVRFIIVLIISLQTNSTEVVSATVLLAIVISVFAISGGVYKKDYLNYLEVWFLFNLLFLVAMVTMDDSRTQIATAISTTLILITFIGIVAFHCWLKLENTKFGNKIKSKVSKFDFLKKKEERNDIEDMVSKEYSITTIRTTSIGIDIRRRESLLYPLVESTNSSISGPVTV